MSTFDFLESRPVEDVAKATTTSPALRSRIELPPIEELAKTLSPAQIQQRRDAGKARSKGIMGARRATTPLRRAQRRTDRAAWVSGANSPAARRHTIRRRKRMAAGAALAGAMAAGATLNSTQRKPRQFTRTTPKISDVNLGGRTVYNAPTKGRKAPRKIR